MLLAAGCTVAPLRPPADNPREAWNRRMQAMKAVDEWALRGKLAVKTNKRGDTVNMYWRRDQGDHNINLYGPMGAGRVVLILDEQGAVLKDGKDKTYYDDSAEDLLYRVVGWRVPFEPMQHWVLGVAAPDSRYEAKLDDWGRLAVLTQNGWKIRFLDYRYHDGQDMPRKMVMNTLPGSEPIVGGEVGENDTIQVKAVIRRWDWPQN
ncbi:MAG: Outer-membrane lipoprotein LolB [Gammaproteobacteria bacterium]|nr:Outer-membrane lipoprotein LolB [Gammaproteobacteria bacterium]